MTIFISFARIRLKIILDKKFLPPYLIILFIGICGIIVNILFFLYLNLTKNDNTNQDEKNIYNYGNITQYFSAFSKTEINRYELILEIIFTFSYIFFYFYLLHLNY